MQNNSYTLLIVEDSKVISYALTKHFLQKDKNLIINTAFTLKEAREIILNHQIDFILLDLILPDGEGDILINEVNNISKSKIIVLTSEDDDKKREEFFQLGVLDYFSKRTPINFIVNEVLKIIKKFDTHKNSNILIVDDSNFIRNHMKSIFLNRNYTVIIAKDGIEALEKLLNNKIDLMILDLEMPIMSGEDVIYEIRKKKNFLDIPIIVLSSTTDKSLISRILKNGANDFVAKPFSIETVILKTELLLNMSYNQKEIISQKISLEEAQKKITDSIKYSSMIQNSILPKTELINLNLKNNFVIWIPKDIVGGDIYLFQEFNESLNNEHHSFGNGFLFMVIDCVGHGVAGAFMTMVTKTALSSIINRYNYNNPAKILSELNKKIKTTLNQNREDATSDVGLDMAILYFDKNTSRVIFAGAKIPLFYIENKELKVIDGDKHSIGYRKSDFDFEFKNSVINIEDETYFYISTDGLIDQNGGEKDLPFGKKRLKEIILNSYNEDFSKQKEIILSGLNAYQNEAERNDDITMIGFKIKKINDLKGEHFE